MSEDLTPFHQSDHLFHELMSYGDCIPLHYRVDVDMFRSMIADIPENEWEVYQSHLVNRRWGLSLIKHQDPQVQDLVSLRHYTGPSGHYVPETEYSSMTERYAAFKRLSEVFNDFEPDLARTHVIKLCSGGFFAPHRDSYGPGRGTFRLLALLDNCSSTEFKILLEDRALSLEPGRVYFLNTRKEHCAFSFAENSHQLVLNVRLTQRSVRNVLQAVAAK